LIGLTSVEMAESHIMFL